MNDTAEISPERAALQKELLGNDFLGYTEEMFPGTLRVGPCRRNHGVIFVKGARWEFVLKPDTHGGLKLYLNWPKTTAVDRRLRALAFHRVAEVMLAIRDGHKEASRQRAATKTRSTKQPTRAGV